MGFIRGAHGKEEGLLHMEVECPMVKGMCPGSGRLVTEVKHSDRLYLCFLWLIPVNVKKPTGGWGGKVTSKFTWLAHDQDRI